ncbi:MAG TPA: VWA domain-containing protein [Candidatus Polarisedimenticolaceae bacterium]|nr:VWA domain-containing protein [Candidatus Polarisedimenticolaceae bacterium]
MTARGRLALVAVLAACAHPAAAQDAVLRRGFSVKITAPAPDDFVVGRTKIQADVRSPSPGDVDRVEFLVQDKVIFVDREPPFECVHDFGEESKAWVIRALAYHREGFSVSDVVVTRKITVESFEQVNRVILWVTVTDRSDRLVSELKKEDFTVFEDGARQTIKDFMLEDRPITMAIVQDSSGSMRDAMGDVHQAAASFVETLRPQDRALVIDFDDHVFLLQELTADQALLKEAVTSTEALGATALYDALHAAFRKLRGIEGRKAIVLLSDGDDTSSLAGFDRILEEAKGQSVLLYAIGLGEVKKSVLRELAETTGGRAFFVGKAVELGDVYKKIAEELRRQYYLSYTTTNSTWDGRFVKLEVRANNPDWTVRARRGYFAVRGGLTPGAESPPRAR